MIETLFVLLTYDPLIFKHLIMEVEMELLPLFCFILHIIQTISLGV